MKSKGHIYMANLLIEELKTKGYFTIEENGVYRKHNVPDIVKESILTYPSYFRGGSMGPDFFPDFLFGQMIIHPEDSGKWLNLMYKELCAMPLKDDETKKAWAFYMGFMVHYSGDMFTHRYVNHYAQGWFPSVKGIFDDIINGKHKQAIDKSLIIVRHMVLEAYMDQRIEMGLESIGKKVWITNDYTINAPIEFLRSCFATKAAIEKAANITKSNADRIDFTEFNFIKAYVNYLEKYREEALKNYYEATNSTDIMSEDDFDNCTQKISENINRMEEMINSWLRLWEKLAQKSLYAGTKTTLDEIKPDLFVFVPEYIAQDSKYLDDYRIIKKIVDFFNAIHLSIPLLEYIFDKIVEHIKDKLKDIAYPYVLEVAKIIAGPEKAELIEDFDEAIETIKGVFTDPIHLINNPLLFDDFNFSEKLKSEWDNLGKTTDGNKITFLPFYQGLVMSKLCLIGSDELNGISQRYGEGAYFRKGHFSSSLQKLRIIVNTSKDAYADTNKDVYFKIILNNSSDIVLPLVNNRDNFKKGRQDIFELELPCTVCIEDIIRFEIQLVGKNLWIFDNISILDSRTGIIIATKDKTRITHNQSVAISLFNNFDNIYENCEIVNSVSKLAITVKTANVLYAGTDNDVSIRINYTNGENYSIVLDKYLYNDFEKNDIDTYYMNLDKPMKLNQLESFTISKNGSDDWKVKEVIIYDADTNLCLCRAHINKWVDSNGYTYPLFNIKQVEAIDNISSNTMISDLLVTVKTKSEFLGGTNNNVFIDVNYTDDNGNNETEKYYLDTKMSDNFESGDLDTYILRMRNPLLIKNINSFKMYCTGDDHWSVEYLTIHDLDTLYHFGTAQGNWIRTEDDFIMLQVRGQ